MLWGLFLLASGVSMVGAAFRASPLRRAGRRLHRTVRRLRRERRAVREALGERTRELEASAEAYAASRRGERLAATDLETLRSFGASGVRLAPLEEAGIRTVRDLMALDRRALEAIDGVGPTSAARLEEAIARLRQRIEQEPVDLPAPDLGSEAARPLAAAALDVLAAEDVLGGVGERLDRLAEPLEDHRRRVRGQGGFWAWLTRDEAASAASPAYREAVAAHRRAQAELEAGLLATARERRQRARDLPTLGRGPKALAQDFRQRYADACALIESVLPQVAHDGTGGPAVAGPLTGRLPSEIAAAVEAFALRTDGLRVNLRRYQVFGAKYLLHQRRTVLGDEMGLGKTIETLAAMTHRHVADGARHFLVVAPASIAGNWVREIGRRTELEPHLLHGADRHEEVDAWLERGGVAVVSYATLRTLGLDERLARDGQRVAFLAADEAHYVKNVESGRTQAVRALLPHAEHVALMTGTPMENHPGEFCDLIAMVAPQVAATLRADELVTGEAILEPAAFHRAVAPVYLRRNQPDVLRELPPKIDFEEWVDPTPADRAAYRDALEARNLMGMRRAVTTNDAGEPSAKEQRLEELLAEHRESGRKVIVFSYFLGVLEALAARIDPIGVITGDVPAPRRMEIVDRFQQAEGHAVLLGQIRAAGVGLNLQAASVVVLMEPQWKPSEEEQAIARAHRMGQTESVLVHRLLARDSVDERIVEILEGKMELFEAYARESLVKKASRQATEAAWADLVLEVEQRRLADGAGSGQTEVTATATLS